MRATRLLAVQLAHFATPKTWDEIFALTPTLLHCEWRACVMQAESDGYLAWTRGSGREVGAWNLTEKGRDFIALIVREEHIMGAFRVELDAVGGHGCQRERRDGDTVHGCGSMSCPDCITSDYVARMRRAGVIVTGATISHWPGTPQQVTDEYQLAESPVLPLAKRTRRGSF